MKQSWRSIIKFCLFLFGIAYGVWFGLRFLLPDELTLLQGQTTSYILRVPVSAKTEESVEVLGIRTEPLADELHLDFGTQVTAEAKSTGNTEVTFYLLDIPIKTVSANVLPDVRLIPCGQTVGVQLDTNGLLVLGTGYVETTTGEKVEPCKQLLQTGDLIQSVNGTPIQNKEQFIELVDSQNGNSMQIAFLRNGKTKTVTVTPVYSPADKAYKLGIWIRDSIQGIGTVTFFDETSNTFGALGHGVYDVDTGELMSLKHGHITDSELTEVIKGEQGAPGQLSGTILSEEVLGEIEQNTDIGIYGTAETIAFTGESYPLALQHEIQEGEAVLLSDFNSDTPIAYEIEIETVYHNTTQESKSMVVHVTDERLLETTGGIVQGMSGSPIIQNGKFIGAVTHVFIQDPTRGYGIWIGSMLAESQ